MFSSVNLINTVATSAKPRTYLLRGGQETSSYGLPPAYGSPALPLLQCPDTSYEAVGIYFISTHAQNVPYSSFRRDFRIIDSKE